MARLARVGALALSAEAWSADRSPPGDRAWWDAVRATGERGALGRVLLVARAEDGTTVTRDATAIADALALGRPVRPVGEPLAPGTPWALLLPAADEAWDPRWYLGLKGRFYEAELGRVGAAHYSPDGPPKRRKEGASQWLRPLLSRQRAQVSVRALVSTTSIPAC